MAGPLHRLSVLSRIRTFAVTPLASYCSCRFASRGPGKVWMGHNDEEQDLDDVEDKLQKLIDEGRKTQRSEKHHMLRRQMTPSGAPERRLSWDAIEQIRYLKNEQPEEWTVERLAEGFCVTPDAILRVLRSKFTPSLERKAKQDAKVMIRLGQQALPSGPDAQQDKVKLRGNSTSNRLPLGSINTALVPVSGQTQVMQGQDSGSLVRSPAPVPVPPSQLTVGVKKDGTVTSTVEDITGKIPAEEDDDSWDGLVLAEEELEEFLEMEKPSRAVQLGNEFFDAQGNFLYRI